MQAPMQRMGTLEDSAFLARMSLEASIPPFERSFWDELVAPTGGDTLAFLEQMVRENASNWGNAEDFIILELGSQPAACCAVFRPSADTYATGPLNLDKLDAIAGALGWSGAATAGFKSAYQKAWGENPECLKPQADAIVETVAVAPGFRGRRLGHALMAAAFDRARVLGAGSIGIMAVQGNTAAQSLYERYFEKHSTFYGAYFGNQIPGLTKYISVFTGDRKTPTKSSKNDGMIVMYNLAPGQDESEFEKWLRQVDLPGYAKASSMSDPVYYRAEETLSGETPPYRYVVTIKSEPGSDVDAEMGSAAWAGFIADFESRTRDAVYVSATRIIG